ncbi:unnamed protein product [Acanthoscelides obtectus]|uniref:Uncharacterized protein n=1 Tax=Acanthoscelides obtectus TaxID=200917 RepID=A0A9P0P4T2_ACAOB|nr:unnamed protein product [Acanthoscelides obtectus]CAK1683089.1 hypothetical protein AOBTE_LOCUS34072 [Acanthoscelides obtectus]
MWNEVTAYRFVYLSRACSAAARAVVQGSPISGEKN